MSELPKTWVKIEIGKICELINGRAFKPTDWTATGLPIVRIQNLNNPDAPFNRFDGQVRDRFLIEHGVLLFAWSGTPGTSFGAHVWNGGKAVLNQHIFHVIFDADVLDRDFLRHAINQKLEELINKAHGGVGLRHVTKGTFEETEIELPPRPEQRRIVSKLDSLIARTKAACAELACIPLLIEHYRQAILAKAFVGTLTSDWRESHSIPLSRWESSKIENISKIITEFTPPTKHKNKYFGGDIPFFKPTDLDAGYHVKEPRETLTSEGAAVGRKIPPRSTLVTCIGATIGKTGFARVQCCTNQQINAVIPEKGRVVPEWLFWMIMSPPFQSQILDNASATTLPIINKSRFSRLTVSLPPWEEQVEIVHRIELALDWLNVVSTEQRHAARLAGHLGDRLRAKAFRGELVPQDPNDEPAEKLLERIRTVRALPSRRNARSARR